MTTAAASAAVQDREGPLPARGSLCHPGGLHGFVFRRPVPYLKCELVDSYVGWGDRHVRADGFSGGVYVERGAGDYSRANSIWINDTGVSGVPVVFCPRTVRGGFARTVCSGSR